MKVESGAERVMEPTPTIEPIPAAIVLGILSLGVKNPRYNPNDPRFGPKVHHAGSGVVVEHQGQRFLATAYHVAEPCGFAPLVREWGEWKKWLWGPAVVDKGSDIAMIQDLDQKRDPAVKVDDGLSTQPAYGEVGRAIGFPRVSLEEYESSIRMTGQYKGLPIPVNVPITASLWEIKEEDEKPVIRMAGGYINGGFSGGAVIWPFEKKGEPGHKEWRVCGIIIERGILPRENAEGEVWYEPTGFVKFVDIAKVTELIRNATKGSPR